MVAAVLVIAILFSLALVFSDFTTTFVSSTQEETSNSTQKTLGTTEHRFDLQAASYDKIGNSVEVEVTNERDKIDENLTATVFCDQDAFQREVDGLPKRGLKKFTVEGVDCRPDRVRLSMQDLNVEDEIDDIENAGSETLSVSGTDFETIVKTASTIAYQPLELARNVNEKSESSSYSGTKNNITVSGGTIRLEKAS